MIRKNNKSFLVLSAVIITLFITPVLFAVGAEKSAKIDINKASVEELQSIKGIGPVLAKSIVEYRNATPFENIEDIKNVTGVGEKVFEKIKDQITVEPSQ